MLCSPDLVIHMSPTCWLISSSELRTARSFCTNQDVPADSLLLDEGDNPNERCSRLPDLARKLIHRLQTKFGKWEESGMLSLLKWF